MKIKLIYIVLSFIAVLPTGCNKAEKRMESEYANDYMLKSEDEVIDMDLESSPSIVNLNQIEAFPQKLIKNGFLRFQVENVKESTEKINKVILKYKAYISNSHENNNGYTLESNVTIRVKNDHFDELMKELLEFAIYVDSKNTETQDVTDQFVDIEARLKTKREVEKRYLEILKKAGKVEEILKVEQQLGIIREEIESQEGRLKYLSDKVSFSTLQVSYYERLTPIKSPEARFGNKFFDAITSGFDLFLGFIIGLVTLWPFLLIVPMIVYFIIKRRKKNRERKQ